MADKIAEIQDYAHENRKRLIETTRESIKGKPVARRKFLNLGVRAGLIGGAFLASHKTVSSILDSVPSDVEQELPKAAQQPVAVSPSINHPEQNYSPPNEKQPDPKLTSEEKRLPDVVKKPVEKLGLKIQQLNNILSKKLGSSERQKAEENYLMEIDSVPDDNPTERLSLIDQGFLVLTEPKLRAQLLDLRYGLREKGVRGLQKLTEGEFGWIMSEKRKVHPEILGLAMDFRTELINWMQPFFNQDREQFFKTFRPDIIHQRDERKQLTLTEFDKLTLDDLFISPGAMAVLIASETKFIPTVADTILNRLGLSKNHFRFVGAQHGLSNIGKSKALDEISKEPKSKELIFTLQTVFDNVTKTYGLVYPLENLPGSLPRAGEQGGAISLQFRPDTLGYLQYFFQEHFKVTFNPMDIKHATIGAFLLISRGAKQPEKYGYIKGKLEIISNGQVKDLKKAHRYDGVEQWYGALPKEITRILEEDDDYWANFAKTA